jgi:hypothetical protein
MANVRFIKTTKIKYLNRDTYDENALYFCQDTNEIFKGSAVYTDGIRVIPTKADLPECKCAADGVVYYITETRNGYTLSPDRTEWLQTIYAPVTDAYTVPESEIYNTITTVGAVRDIENTIYAYIDENLKDSSVSNLVPVDGSITIEDTEDDKKAIRVAISTKGDNALTVVEGGLFIPKISVKKDTANGLVAVDGTLSLNLATRNSSGAMSAKDKLVIDSIPYVYEKRKYDISGTPVGTLVDYRDHEIRIMCPTDAEFVKQSVGVNGNANMYYMTFKAYAPEGAVNFKEGDRGVIIDEMFDFNGPSSGIDEFGRKYSVCWLALAMYNPTSNTWTYFGKNSKKEKYLGWYYSVEWYDANGAIIASDCIRINLSNESCHSSVEPYYVGEIMKEVDTKIEERIAEVYTAYEIVEF